MQEEARTSAPSIYYTRIHALSEYVRDRQCHHNQVPDAAGFTNAVMRSYISKSEITDGNGDTLDVAELPKLGENNFHQWEDAIIAQLCAKKGTNNVPLAYVACKLTPPENFIMTLNTLCMKLLGQDLLGMRTRRQWGITLSDN